MNQMELEKTITQALRLMKESRMFEAEQLLQQTNDCINESHIKTYRGTQPQRRHDDIKV
jgi:cellobiose-specific phosphotransferase system component IIA